MKSSLLKQVAVAVLLVFSTAILGEEVVAMRRVISMILLAVLSSSAMAELVMVISSEDGNTNVYADTSTIRKKGNRVKMWYLSDHKEVQRLEGLNPFMSTKGQDEFDCKEAQDRLLSMTSYSGNMGSGEVMNSDNHYGEWMPVTLGSTGEAMWKIACGKLKLP